MNTRSFETLTNLDSEHIWLKISDSDLTNAQLATKNYSNQTGKHNCYLNSLVTSVFVPWIEQKLGLTNVNLCATKPETWEFVNGSSITINFSENGNSKRLILIPSEAIDTEEFTIPQEWVDIPNWAGDYYLPVQLELESEEKYLHIWGFVSRETVKKTADFDPTFREYFVSVDNIIYDLDLLYSALELCEEKGELQSLPELSTETAQKLITQLSEVSRYSPRLDVNFSQWAALLNNEKWLTKLYHQRVNYQLASKRTNLRDWLENKLDQAIELGWLLRSDYLPREPIMSTATINNPISRAKLLNLQLEIGEKSVVLLLIILTDSKGRYNISLQVHPFGNNIYLPNNLSVSLCLISGEKLQTVTSRFHNNYIQLRQFSCDNGDEFKIEISLEGVTISEKFCI